jgi:nucleoid-associated protein YgaU
MGSFEKLGILVIVVIIVMILAVAIYQWGGTGVDPALSAGMAGGAPSLVVQNKKPYERNFLDEPGEGAEPAGEAGEASRDEPKPDPAPEPDRETWRGGIPRTYTIQPGDSMWVVVVKRWKLKEAFVDAIARANPKADMRNLRPGKTMRIPNPEAYWPGYKSPRASGNLRTYEVAEGDLLETIAREHLGRRSRWRDIVEVNPGLNPKKMRPGQRIYLPAR